MTVNVRAHSEPVRRRVLQAVARIVAAEAAASGASTPPSIETEAAYPVLVNDPAATERTVLSFREAFGGPGFTLRRP